VTVFLHVDKCWHIFCLLPTWNVTRTASPASRVTVYGRTSLANVCSLR